LNALSFFVCKIRTRRQAKAIPEQRCRNAVAVIIAIAEDRLHVHRLPQRSAFDVFVKKFQTQIFARKAGFIGIYNNRRKPVVGKEIIGRLRQQTDAVMLSK